jgi:Zn-dependent peptidase ImmA (M78 family)
LLRHYAVHTLSERVFEHDARLSIDAGRLAIEVNSAFPRVRQRLSIAHEIAHLIVRESFGDASTDHRDPVKESFCNELAGILLAPDWAVRAHFENVGGLGEWQERIRCSTLLAAAAVFDVSLDVMARRVLHDLRLAPHMVAVVWRHRENTGVRDSSKALRVSTAWHSLGSRFFVPLNKTASAESVISKAYDHDGVFVREEDMRLGSLKGRLTIEATGFHWFPLSQGSRPARGVLSMLKVPDSPTAGHKGKRHALSQSLVNS